MSDRDQSTRNICQLQGLPGGGEPLALSDRLRLLTLRLLSAAERRLGRSRPNFFPAAAGEEGPESAGAGAASVEIALAEGDWVEVRSLEEIRNTLDDANRCKGLEFMPGMEQFCGKRLLVRKKVRAIFDERAWRMLKTKSTFLLEGCICDGRGMYEKEGCDRCCFYFWKEDWLKRLP